MLKFWTIFYKFLIISGLTFGGGMAMIPLITELIVDAGIIDNVMFLDFISISELLPGPFATDVATFIGMQYAGIGGLVFALLGLLMPTFVIITLINIFGKKALETKVFKHIISFIKMGVIGFILAIAFNIFQQELFPNLDLKFLGTMDFTGFKWQFIPIFMAIFGVSKIPKMDNPFILLGISAVLGYFFL